MLKKTYFIFVAIIFMASSCVKQDKNNTENPEKEKVKEEIIGKKTLKLTSDVMTPEVLWSNGYMSDVQISQDKKTLLFGITYFSIEQNKGNRDLYTIPSNGGDLKQITKTASGEYNAVWISEGKKIAFMSPESGAMQIWQMNPDGSDKEKVSEIEGGISGFKFSPDSKKILFIKEVDLVKDAIEKYPDLPQANAKLYDDMQERHWSTWTESYTHIFVADFADNSVKNQIDIMENEEFDAPIKPFGGLEQINWSPDGKKIAYTCVKKKGRNFVTSTNSDIYIYKLDTKETENLTSEIKGYDVAPVFSPDGNMLAWESMERDGYESDKKRIFIYDFNTKEKTDYSKDFDQNAEGLSWDDSKTLYFVSDYHACFQMYKLDIADKKITQITKGRQNYYSVEKAGDKLIGVRQTMQYPADIFAVNPENGEEAQITFINKEITDQLSLGKVEERWVKTTDNKDMLVWVIYPPHFDPNKKYPALLYCQGGPQASVSQFYSLRWNFQMMAADGYIVVAPNRRGLPSFGQEWNEAISGDYSGQCMKDYLSAIDDVKQENYVDENRLGAIGASFGGFSVYWLAGNHEKRFKAFIAHAGMFNLESMYLQTDEAWFVNWDLGGNFWDKSNKIAQKSYANSPHKFVDKWDTPIMIIHGGKDYRIPYTQGLSAFHAARLKNIPARLLLFPEENHWVLKPQNGILWQREFANWLDTYLK